MPETEINPKDTIDRSAEQELFEKLVAFTTPARMLVISDKMGRGKSTLLKRLRYNCKYLISPSVPAGLVDLRELREDTPFAFVEKLIDSFNIPERFPQFLKFDNARQAKNISLFDAAGTAQHQTASGSGAVFSGSVNAGGHVAGRDININPPPPADFTNRQESIARRRCIEAFFEDLRVFCAKQPLVILLDHWEQCNYDLRDWITTTFLGDHCFNSDKNLRPDKLAIVVAGDTYDKAEKRSGIREDEFSQVVKGEEKEVAETVLSRRSLSEWESDHVREFLEQHGYKNISQQDIDLLRDFLKTGKTLRQILLMVGVLVNQA